MDFSTLNKPEISKTLRSLLIHSGVDLTLTLVFGESPKKPRSWVFDREFLFNRLDHLNPNTAPILKGYVNAEYIYSKDAYSYFVFRLLPLVEPPFTTEQTDNLDKLCNIEMQGISRDKTEKSDSKNKSTNPSESESTEFGIWSLVQGNFLISIYLFIIYLCLLYILIFF